MMYRWSFLAVGLVLFTCSYTGASDLSKFLHHIFDKHAGRPPTGTEMNYQANLMRDQGPLECYISLFAPE